MTVKADQKKARIRIHGSVENKALIDQFMKRMKSLARTIPDMSYVWVGQGEAGSDSVEHAEEYIRSGNIHLLMVSQQMLDDEEVYDRIALALQLRDQRPDVRVIPILTKECQWEREMFKGLVPLPRDNSTIADAADKDKVLTQIMRELTGIIEAYIAGASAAG